MLGKMQVGRRQTLERKRVAIQVYLLAFSEYADFMGPIRALHAGGESMALFTIPFERGLARHPSHEFPSRAHISIVACLPHAL